MELPHIGQVCVICQRNDYLPFKCAYCDKTVCIDHKTNHGEGCPLNGSRFEADTISGQASSLKQSCDFCKKITLKLELVECLFCKGMHCLYHRHQVQHECQKLAETQESLKLAAEEKSERQRAALEKLRETYKSNPACQAPKQAPPTQILDQKKQELAKKVRIMRIRQTARGPPNILQEDRIYFEVKFIHNPELPISDMAKNGKVVKIFTTLKHSVGRMLDWSADELGVKNKNHIQEASQLVFKKQISANDFITLDSQISFSKYIDDKILDNGDEIILTYQ